MTREKKVTSIFLIDTQFFLIFLCARTQDTGCKKSTNTNCCSLALNGIIQKVIMLAGVFMKKLLLCKEIMQWLCPSDSFLGIYLGYDRDFVSSLGTFCLQFVSYSVDRMNMKYCSCRITALCGYINSKFTGSLIL